MTEREIQALVMIVAADNAVPADEIGRALAAPRYSRQPSEHRYYELGWIFTRPLVKAGLLRKLAGNYRTGKKMSFVPTESGRIAAALLMSKKAVNASSTNKGTES